jgi:hypothetical protein
MNERITQLAEQSWVDNFGPDGFMDAEKFAELIVRECLRVIGATPSMTDTAKKHFGVEA